MPGYEGSSSENDSADLDKDGTVTIRGRLCFIFDLGSPVTEKHRSDYLGTMAKRGYKVGLRVKRDQGVRRLAFAGEGAEVVLTPSAAVTEELQHAFPCRDDELWVGLVPPAAGTRRYSFRDDPRRLIVCYEFTLVVTGVHCPPQPIPLVLTYGDEQFRRHYLLHVVVLADLPGVRVTTHAVSP